MSITNDRSNNSYCSNKFPQQSDNKINNYIQEVLEENKNISDILKSFNLNCKSVPKSQLHLIYSHLQPFLFQRNKINQCVERLDRIISLTQNKKSYLLSKLDIIVEKEKEAMTEIVKLVRRNIDSKSNGESKRSQNEVPHRHCQLTTTTTTTATISTNDDKKQNHKSSLCGDNSYKTEPVLINSHIKRITSENEIYNMDANKLTKMFNLNSTNTLTKKKRSSSSKSSTIFTKQSIIKDTNVQKDVSLSTSNDNIRKQHCKCRSNSAEIPKKESVNHSVTSSCYSIEQDKCGICNTKLCSNLTDENSRSMTANKCNVSEQTTTINIASNLRKSQTSSKTDYTNKKPIDTPKWLPDTKQLEKPKIKHRRSESAEIIKNKQTYIKQSNPITKQSSVENILKDMGLLKTFSDNWNNESIKINPKITDNNNRTCRNNNLKNNIDENQESADLIQKIITKFDSVKQFIDKHKKMKKSMQNIQYNCHKKIIPNMTDFININDERKHLSNEIKPFSINKSSDDTVKNNQRHLKEQDIISWLHKNLEHQKKMELIKDADKLTKLNNNLLYSNTVNNNDYDNKSIRSRHINDDNEHYNQHLQHKTNMTIVNTCKNVSKDSVNYVSHNLSTEPAALMRQNDKNHTNKYIVSKELIQSNL